MPKLLRNIKWEWAFYAAISGAVVMAIIYGLWRPHIKALPGGAAIYRLIPLLIVVRIVGAYFRGRRYQSRIDALQEALKQSAAGNWEARLPEERADAFAGAYREFNRLQQGLAERLRLLQQLGEKEVMGKAATVEEAVLEERRRLARDLHDTVSQQLFAIHMSASALPALLDKNPEHAGRVMQQLIEMSKAAQRQMRGLIAQLRPLELQGRTLPEALDRWFPDYCRQNGMQGTLDVRVSAALPPAMEHQLFLIIQEAMANVMKHSGADEVRLVLGETDRQVLLSIDDDGEGFSADQVKAGSYGLTTMRERAIQLGGDVEIATKPGAGTRIKVGLPKFAQANERDGRG
ncbi:sensor histidine kinase [Cohnella rhizosphaerae]|uniref:Oxygen sensor histidine kinase NreB n=1 Tax=Cohnella rhizosphaerae TaxID=1457232 RepID=A0A9X4KQ16_9BACL|nr:sensor histidine kinase [Cohnella rhizosphaerae]MDG0808770.1 sensor histidine kinase [Cohnella rhizosphaerae]